MNRAHLSLLVAIALVSGCGNDSTSTESATVGGTEPATDGDPTGGAGPLVAPPAPKILSGTQVQGNFTKVEVGHISRPDATSGCCKDYVLGGRSQNYVRVMFGGVSNGLSFLSPDDDQPIPMSMSEDGLVDIAVSDVDSDGFPDVLALRSDGVVAIRSGLNAIPPDPVLGALQEVSLALVDGMPSRALAVGDLDCVNGPDLAALDPENDRVIVAMNDGMGGFQTPFHLDVGAGTAPQSLVVADINNTAGDDLVVGTADGRLGVILNGAMCGSFDSAVLQVVFPVGAQTPNVQIAVGALCSGMTTTSAPAVALGFGDQVRILCNDGGGDFSAEGEEHGQSSGATDYLVDFNGPNAPSTSAYQIFQMQYWAPSQTLYLLMKSQPGSEVARVVLSADQLPSGWSTVTPLFGMGDYQSFSVHQEILSSMTEWTRIVFVSGDSVGFTR